jgi:hypothetical protein
MDIYKLTCPYCDYANLVMDYEEGYTAIECRQCGQPFLNLTKMVPQFTSLRVVGFVDVPSRIPTLEEIEEDAKYYAKHPEELDAIECNDCIECNDAEQTPTLCEQNGQNVNKSDDKLNRCSKCGLAYEDHGITSGICPVCFLDEDSVKGIEADSIPPEIPFRSVPGQHVLYRIKSGLVEIKYMDNKQVVLSREEIYKLHTETDRRPLIASMLGKTGNKPKITGVNIFLKAMDEGLIPEFPATKSEDDDADFKPMLSSVVNTRCNYDGSKIGGWA